MNKYNELKKQKFLRGEYFIIPIQFDFMESIRIWRNSQVSVLRQKRFITTEEQTLYYHNSIEPLFEKESPCQILFGYFNSNILIGYGGLVHISWEDKRAEMSFLVDNIRAQNDELYAKDFSNFIELIKEVCFCDLNFNRLFTETFEFRGKHISIIESCGFKYEGRMRQHIYEQGKYYDSILHSILKEEYV